MSSLNREKTVQHWKMSNFPISLPNPVFLTKIKTTHPNTLQTTKILAPWPKPGPQQLRQMFGLKTGFLTTLTKIAAQWDLEVKNFFIVNHYGLGLVVNHKRKQFWNRKIFHVKKGKNVNFLQRVKKVTAVDGSQVLKLFLEKLCKNLQYIQNLEGGFWFWLRNSIF